MKLNYAKAGIVLFLMVFGFLLAPIPSHAAVDTSSYIVENLRANDIPDDDGSGLVLSWKPLPKEKRIIEYRIYRGVTSDSLFYHGKVDVNVKTGVAGDVMYYYDSGYNRFVDIQSPRKLKKEKQQPDDSPLFGRLPRDITVTGPQLTNYRILGVIPEKDFLYKNTKIEITEDDETKVYAGLKLRHFHYLLKKLRAEKEYYYTVIAVTESRKYMPYAEPVIGIPIDNSPEKIRELYSVYVEDKTRLQFEWIRSLFTDDQTNHSVYLVKKTDLNKFNAYVEEQQKAEMDPELETSLENPAQLIYQRYCGYPYTPDNTVAVNIIDGKIINEDRDIDVEVGNIEDYVAVFSLQDRAGYETFSDPSTFEITNSSNLPKISDEWIVEDRKNDKGDYNAIYWEKPTVFLTNCTYLNDDKTKILVNYDIYKNVKYDKIKNVYFIVSDEDGKEITSINEFYQDNKLKITLEKPSNKISFEMRVVANGDTGEDQIYTQDLIFNEDVKSLQPGLLYLNGEEVNKYTYSIYKNNYSNEEWRLSKNTLGAQREIVDNISFSSTTFKGVSKFDAKKGLFLVTPTFTVRLDDELENPIVTNLYAEEVAKSIENYKKEIAEYTASKDTLETEADITNADAAIEYYQEQIELVKNNPILKKAATIKSKKSRLKFLEKVKTIAGRSFKYKMVKTDGKAHFALSEVYYTEEVGKLPFNKSARETYTTLGKDHFYPIPNWFQADKLPALFATFIFGFMVFFMIRQAKSGKELYIRPIAGIDEIDNAIGRATEMGKPILFVPGLSGISDVATLAGLSILGRVAKKAAEYDTKILVPVRDYIVLPIAQEVVKEAHYEAGRPDSHDKNSVFFITTAQFAFVAGVNGIMIREKTATNFYMGMFFAESLIMTETGSTTGAIQIAGTDAVTQIPFFITTCDYTLIGEELYAASAYLAREPLQLGTLKAVDYYKFIILAFVIIGTIFSTVHATFLINAFPTK
ncbi:MAG: DUF6754 domain-containing protein [Candidatus Cloacimonadota bacterium]|nr:DUF6754 domain-containing protein [Candidatus Cloacimonadota bacterium]